MILYYFREITAATTIGEVVVGDSSERKALYFFPWE
jgi:hypothetical protein